jgi:hypothetical protein
MTPARKEFPALLLFQTIWWCTPCILKRGSGTRGSVVADAGYCEFPAIWRCPRSSGGGAARLCAGAVATVTFHCAALGSETGSRQKERSIP